MVRAIGAGVPASEAEASCWATEGLIAEAMQMVGQDSVITVEKAKGMETTFEGLEGRSAPRGPVARRKGAAWQDRTVPRQAPALADRVDRFYAAVRLIVRFWLWFFFKPVDVRHPDRVPAIGPVLLCINHPNNLIDSLIVGAALRRKVHFLATATLFRNPLVAHFLRACGAIRVSSKDLNTDAVGACLQAHE